MLKISVILEKLIFRQLKVSDSEVDKFDISSSEKSAKKPRKSKNLSKSGNLSKIDIKKTEPSF